MRVLVTGSRGFVGKHLVATLATAGHTGIASGRIPPESLPDGWIGAKRSDFLDADCVNTQVDAIVHLEVKHHVARATLQDREEFREVNVDGTVRWLSWATAHNVEKLVLASSVKAIKDTDGCLDELADPEISDPYGASKAEAEAAVRTWAGKEPERSAIALRFPPIYGVGNIANLAAFARQVLAGKPCLIGRGQARKSVLSVRNATACILHALQMPAVGYEVYHAADADPVSLFELACYIAEAGGVPKPRSVSYPVAIAAAFTGEVYQRITGAEFPMNLKRFRTLTSNAEVSTQKLHATGFRPIEGTRQGVKDMVDWLQSDHGSKAR
jgi:nucleoside-diphosphate-sugar epimerase